MADNHPVTVELFDGGQPIRFTVANATTISAAQICKLTDPRTASASTGTGDIFAGISAAEKLANDGSTTLALYTKGIFDMTAANGAITLGDVVTSSGANLIRTATEAERQAGKGIGKALETCSATEVIRVDVGRTA